MKYFSSEASLQEITYSKFIPFMIIGIVTFGLSLITSYFIHVESYFILILIFLLLPLLFIAGIEKLFMLLIFSAFIPVEFTFGGVEGWEIKDFLMPIFLLLFVGWSFIKKESLNRKPRFSIPLLLFLFISVAHILTLQELPKIIESFLYFTIPAGELRIYYDIFICGIAYFLVPFLFREESHIELLVKLLGGACIFLIIFSFIRIYLGIDTILPEEAYRTRIHYVPIGENIVPRVGIMGFAGYLLFVIGIIFVKRRSNILFLLLTIISLAAIVQSGGRAMLLGVIFAISLYLFLSGKKFKAAILPVGLLLILFLIGLNPKIARKFPPVLYRHLTTFSSENPSLVAYGNNRMEMWTISWEIISTHPFWGARSVKYEWAYHEEVSNLVRRGSAHNAYLSTAASFGLPALILWLMVAVLYFKKIINLYRKTYPFSLLNKFCLLLAILLGVSFLTFFLEGRAGGGFRYFLYLGLIDSAWNMYNKNQS